MFRQRDRIRGTRPGGGAPVRRLPPPVRVASLSDAALPEPDPAQRPWPGRTVVVDGCGIRVRHTPGPSGAEAALYVHGLAGDATNFTDLAALLAPFVDGHALDLPGFGGSDPAPGGDYSVRAQSRMLVRTLEHLDRGPVHLFGNSLGGLVGIAAAAARPDLVRTLTLVSPAMPSLRPRRGAVGQMQLLLLPGARTLVERQLARYTPEERLRAVIATCFGDPSRVPDHRFAQAVEDLERRGSPPWATHALVGSVRGLAAAYLTAGRGSPWNQASRIGVPTLVVWGGRDRLVDVSLAPRTARAFPDARLLVLPDAGHTAHIEDPASVARAFLELRGSGGATPHSVGPADPAARPQGPDGPRSAPAPTVQRNRPVKG